jgi:enoyl-CoA hydratase
MSERKYIKSTIKDTVMIITIDNPPANALSTPVMMELNEALEEMKNDDGVNVCVLTGAGMFFVAGADIKEIATIETKKVGMEKTSQGQAIFNVIEKSEKPVIAAINGMCLGGGLELAMACHMRVSSDRAVFGQPEIKLGIIPGFGGTQRLSRLVGKAKAIEWILTGDRINAREAWALGLVNKIVPSTDVLKQSVGLAKKITSSGQVAVRAALKAINEGFSMKLEDGLRCEIELFGDLCETFDMKEGVQAFIEKRQPRFENR